MQLYTSVEYKIKSSGLEPARIVKKPLHLLTRSAAETHVNIQEYINARLAQNMKAKSRFRNEEHFDDSLYDAPSMDGPTEYVLETLEVKRGPPFRPTQQIGQPSSFKMRKIDRDVNRINKLMGVPLVNYSPVARNTS